VADDLTSNGEPSETGPSLTPYFLILFGASAGLGSIIVLLAEIRNELGFTETGIGLAIAAGFAAAFVANIIMAPHADRGRAPAMLRGGLALGVVGLLVLAVGQDLWHYVLGRAVFGFALGTAGPAARRTVIVADPANLGRNMGRLGAWDVGGFVAGPMIASLLAAIGGFRFTFWFMAISLATLLPVAFRAQPDTAARDEEGLGLKGLLRIRRLVGAFFVVAAYFVFIGAFEAVWVLEMDTRGATQTTMAIGLTLAALPIAMLSPLGGSLAQRYGARRWAIGGIASITLLTTFYGVVPGVVALVALTMVTSVLEGFAFPSAPMLVAAAVAENRQAAAQGLMGAVEVATAAVAAVIISIIYDRHSDLVAWIVTASTMAILLLIGAILTRPEDRQLVRPGVPSDPTRRPFQ
jgi:MFS family permease|tara:strand:+ start:61 stop:1284 length:1224 start_codon:yes stop_codon:yes gene_type:complete